MSSREELALRMGQLFKQALLCLAEEDMDMDVDGGFGGSKGNENTNDYNNTTDNTNYNTNNNTTNSTTINKRTLSRQLFLTIMRMCDDNFIDLGNLFYWHVCSYCGTVFLGENSFLEESSSLRRWTRLNRGLYCLASRTMGLVDGFKAGSAGSSECSFFYLECSHCLKRIIMDHQPIPLYHPMDAIDNDSDDGVFVDNDTKNINHNNSSSNHNRKKLQDRKKLQLQKILSKNSSLSSFLTKK